MDFRVFFLNRGTNVDAGSSKVISKIIAVGRLMRTRYVGITYIVL
jgi:hypothetical protein